MRAAAAFASASSASATAGLRAASAPHGFAIYRRLSCASRCPQKVPMTSTLKSIHIADDEAGGRLDRVLATHIAELSRTRLKALIEAGAVADRRPHDP